MISEDTKKIVGSLNDINKTLKECTNTLKKLNASFEKASSNVGELGKENGGQITIGINPPNVTQTSYNELVERRGSV